MKEQKGLGIENFCGRWVGTRDSGRIHLEVELELEFDHLAIRGNGDDLFGHFRMFGSYDENSCSIVAKYGFDTVVYDGSWFEASPDDGRPIIVGRWRVYEGFSQGRFSLRPILNT